MSSQNLDDDKAIAGRYWTLILLTLVYALSVLDRYLLGIVLPQIKLEMQLSDTALGLLSGTAFALFYATLGVPIARMADVRSRKKIIAASVAVFSLMTALCGAAKNFTLLFLTRMGVGVGEAGTSPPSYSIISDLFSKEQRSTAMAIFFIGGNIGLLAGFIVGGYVAANYGWRQAFLVAGIPGLVLAPLLLISMREPRRGLSDQVGPIVKTRSTSLRDTVLFMFSQSAFRHLIMGQALLLLVINSVIGWLPSFLERSHGMTADEVGLQMGLIMGLGGPIGMLAVGRLADRYTARDLRWGSWVVAIGSLILVPGYLLVLLAPTGFLAIAAFFIPALMGTFFAGPTAALSQALTPTAMRATSGALLLMVSNLIGLGLGPLGVGYLSDVLNERFAAESLRYALGIAPLMALWGAYHYLQAGRGLAEGIARVEYSDSRMKSDNEQV